MSWSVVGTWLRNAVVTNWPTKATALVLAAVLWAVVEAKQPTTQLVPVRFEMDLPEDMVLADPLPPVQALYAGPTSELIKLYGTPPVVYRQLTDSVTVVDLTPGDLSVARDIDVNPQDIQPRRLTIRLVPGREDGTAGTRPAPEAAGPLAERVLMGVPVTLPAVLRGLETDPPAVAVTVRGPAARLALLTRDSLVVTLPNRAAAAGTWMRATVTAPSGMAATASPDTVRLVETPRG